MKNMFKKAFFVTALITLMTVLFCFGASAKTVPASGSCGDNVTYTYNSTTKELVISGTGAMEDYDCDVDWDGFVGCDSPFHYSDIKSVVIKSGVTNIGDGAFADCQSLQSVTVPDSVTSAGKFAFYNCEEIKRVNITDISKWCKINFDVVHIYFFYGGYYDGSSNPLCYGDLYLNGNKVTNLVIPDGIKSIGEGAFFGYKGLTSVTIPDSVTSVGFYAFGSCIGLKRVYITDIAKWCKFSFDVTLHDWDPELTIVTSNPLCYADLYLNGKKITNLVIPDGVKNISRGLFYGCKGITSVVIPDSVKSVDFAAFYNCTSLKDVYYTGTQEQWKAIDIDTSPSNPYIINCNHYLVNAKIHYNSCGLTHKKIVNVAQQNPTCIKAGYTAGKQCSYCKEWISGHKKLSATGHKYTPNFITKATLTTNGKVIMKCSSCGDSYSKATYAVTTISLSSTKYIYDGTNKTPKVTVKDKKGNALVKGKDYKIAVASKRSGVGRYTVKVTLMGNYGGSKNLYFYILPGAPAAVKSVAQSSSAIKLSWSAVKGAAGYTVYRYNPSRSAYVKVVTTSQTSATAKSLSSGTKYIFKVVAYSKTSAGKVYYSEKYTLLKTATKTKTPSLTVTSPSKGEAALKWTNVSGETGYQIYYSTSKNGTYKKYTNCGVNATNGSIYGLTSGKTYYFKIRTYIKTDSGYVYSPFSAVKSVKIK